VWPLHLIHAPKEALMHRKTSAAARRQHVVHPDAIELASLLRPSWPQISAGIAKSGVPTCEVAEAPLKDKLRRIEAELAEQRDRRAVAVRERDEAREAFAKSDSLSQDSDEFKAAQEKVAALGSIDDRIAELQEMQVATLRMLGKDAPEPRHSRDTQSAGDPSDPRAGWRADALFSDDELRERLAVASASKARFGGIDLGQVASRDALVADVTGTTNMRRGEYAGIVPQLRRRLSVLDLLPTGTMDNNTFPYTKESGSFGTAAETAEGVRKPEAAVTLTDDEAIAATIAHWLKLRKQALADAPALQAVVDGRLRYGVLRRLEGQVLNGDGVGANMRGILQTTGIGAVTFTAGALISDQILKGITTVYLADAEATGIVLHPTDWQTALLAKASGDGHYFSGGPFEITPQQMWGTPLIPSVAVAQGTALVGDFAIGAQLLIREGVNVLLSDNDGEDFTMNRVTMLAEMRAALPVFRPPAFATVALQ
jgi:HK97 family phage major capsid protein